MVTIENETEREEPLIRRYTVKEKALIDKECDAGTPERLVQIIRRIEIDADRFTKASRDHPDHKAHFERLIKVGGASIEAWKRLYSELYDVQLPSVVPYSGTESIAPIVNVAEFVTRDPIPAGV